MAADRSGNDAYVVTLSEGGQVAIPKFMRGGRRAGDRFLIVRHDDGYYLKPVDSLSLHAELRKVRAELAAAVRRAGLDRPDLEALVASVRRERKLGRRG